MRRGIFLLSVACLFLSVADLYGQTTGAIAGVVRDQTGAILPGVTITVTNSATGESRQVLTDENGRYSAPLLPPGTYTVRFELSGFKTVRREGVTVGVTERIALDAVMEVSAVAEELTIVADAPLVQTETVTLGRVVEEMQIRQLPLATRNFTQILGLSPGTSVSVPDTAALGRGTQNISTSGARQVFNNFQINGIDANNIHTNSAQENSFASNGVAIPASDTIQEFKVQTSLYDAEHGRNSGANVNVVTKSGGPEFHGNVYHFFRNEVLNANNFFFNRTGTRRPILRQNQFGGTLGGPIVKDRTYFFGAYQGTRQINGASLATSSKTLILPNVPAERSRASLGRAFAGLRGAQDQRGVFEVAPDGSNIHPVAVALLNAKLPNGQFVIPSPQITGPGANYAVSIPARYDEDQYTVSIDHNINSRNALAGRAFIAEVPQTRPFAGTNLPGFEMEQKLENRNISISDRHTFGPRLFNEARVGYTRHRGEDALSEPVKLSDIGMRRFNSSIYPAIPFIRVTGVFDIGTATNNDQGVTVNTYQVGDTLSIVKGGHNIRLGTEIKRHQVNVFNNFASRGFMQFQTFADFLIGRAAGPIEQGGNGTAFSNILTSQAGTGQTYHAYRIADNSFFIQDDWKVNSQFTVNLGLRYDLLGWSTDKEGRLGNYERRRYQEPPAGGSTQVGFVLAKNTKSPIPGIPLVPKGMVEKTDWNNFAPRIGLAYRPWANRSLVIRSGYGIFYERMSNQVSLQLLSAPPFFQLSTLSGAANAPASFADPFPNLALPSQFPILPTINAPPFSLARPATSIINVDPTITIPYMQHYSLNIQYEFTNNYMLEVGYVGSKGTKLPLSRQRNQARLATPQSPIRGETGSTAGNVFLRVPFLGFGPTGISEVETQSDSRYNSLQVNMLKRFSRNHQFNVSYTWAKGLDNTSGGTSSLLGGLSGDAENLSQARGLSNFDREHRIVSTFIVNLPEFGPRAFHGWQFAGILTAQSGLPINIEDTTGASLYGVTTSRASWAPGATAKTATLSGPVESRLNRYFNTDAFVRAGTVFGNVGRNVLRGPGQSNVDFSIIKKTAIPRTENMNVEFRTEFFNLFNHANFDTPNVNRASGVFGIISETSSNARLIQVALKLNF